MSKIEIRPLDIDRWHKKTGEEAFARPRVIEFLPNEDATEYDTGMSDEEMKKIFAEVQMPDITNFFNHEERHPLWGDKRSSLKLENKTMILKPSSVYDKIRVAVAKKSKYVANSLKAYQDGEYPHATHYISSDAEEIEMLASKLEMEEAARDILHKLSTSQKQDLVLLIAGKDLRAEGSTDKDMIVAKNDLVTNHTKEVLDYSKLSSEEREVEALIIRAEYRRLIKREKEKYFYFDIHIGSSRAEVVKYLVSDEQQELRLKLMKQVSENI